MKTENVAILSKALSDAESVIGDFKALREKQGVVVDSSSSHGFKNGKELKTPANVKAAYAVRDSIKLVSSLAGGELMAMIEAHRKSEGSKLRAVKAA